MKGVIRAKISCYDATHLKQFDLRAEINTHDTEGASSKAISAGRIHTEAAKHKL